MASSTVPSIVPFTTLYMAPSMTTQEYGVQEITSADMATTLLVASIGYEIMQFTLSNIRSYMYIYM